MVNGKQLKKNGWPQGPQIGKAIALSQELKKLGYTREAIWDYLHYVKDNPTEITSTDKGYQLAKCIIEGAPKPLIELRTEVLDYKVWGRDLIPSNTFDQMNQAMQLPVAVSGALMPDAHHGYGIPIGGVVALDNAVAPYMVGMDIACRMMMTIYPDTGFITENNKRELLIKTMRSETRFGLNAGFDKKDRRESWLFDDNEQWEITGLTKTLKEKAYRQMGSSGGGNHFVDAGYLNIEQISSLGLEPGQYFAIMTHSGSRGVGASIAREYTKLVMKECSLPKSHRHLGWFNLDSDLGQQYWKAMNLCGLFASECHHAIHRTIAKKLSIRPITKVENHHNFAWKENHNGTDLIVHRKGATPANMGELGIIPGSQAHDSFIVEGLDNKASLSSASHGAGRQMSRTKAFDTLSRPERDRKLEEAGVVLLGSAMDEAPGAYKDIYEVLAAQKDLVKPVAIFKPKFVLMADDTHKQRGGKKKKNGRNKQRRQ